MNLKDFFGSYQGALAAAKYQKHIIFLLLIANIVMGIALSSKSQTVVLVPPNLEQDAWVSKQDASISMRESWATYVATLVGNVTPRSVNALQPMLEKIVAPSAFNAVMENLAFLRKEVQAEQIEIQFSPTGVFAIPSQNKVAVTGEFRLRSARGVEKKFLRTYLIGVDTRNYRPAVTSLEIMEGAYKPGTRQAEAAAANKEG